MQQPVCFPYPKGQRHCQYDWNEYLHQLNRDLLRIQRQVDRMEAEQAEQSRINQQDSYQTSIDPAGPIDWAVLIERAMLIRAVASTNTASMDLRAPTAPPTNIASEANINIISEANALPAANTIQAKEPMQNEETTSAESPLIRGEAFDTVGQPTYSNSTTLVESIKEIPTTLTPGATINSAPTASNTTTSNPRESTASSPKKITTWIPIETTKTILTMGSEITMHAVRIMPIFSIIYYSDWG